MTTNETDRSALEASRIRKRFGTRVVVKDVSLSIRQGEVVGLLGPNGAGKTTCFYMIAGLIKADQGSIRLGQQVITSEPMDARARLDLVTFPRSPVSSENSASETIFSPSWKQRPILNRLNGFPKQMR